jgi:hydrogenase nickel incorporation protein HypA/HybF
LTHELATIRDLVAKVEQIARENDAARVVRIKVRLGALSHFTPEHFEEHWVDAAAGTIAEGCKIESEFCEDIQDPNAQGVVLEDVEIALSQLSLG